jgi:hypothetical protein
MRCEFHPDALAEYEEAARYYAGCQDGLEVRFMATVEAVVHQIAVAPERWRILEGDVRIGPSALRRHRLGMVRSPRSFPSMRTLTSR